MTIRLVPQLDQMPWVVRWAQHPAGKIALCGLVIACLSATKGFFSPILASLCLAVFLKRASHFLLALSTVAGFMVDDRRSFMPSLWGDMVGGGFEAREFLSNLQRMDLSWELYASRAIVLVLGFAIFAMFRNSQNLLFRGGAIVGLIVIDLILVFAALNPALSPAAQTWLWYIVIQFNRRQFWSVGYLFLHRRHLLEKPAWWWVPLAPVGLYIGKSHAFIDKYRATDAESLARHQLKAVKLAIWVLWAALALRLFGSLLKRPGFEILAELPLWMTTPDIIAMNKMILAGHTPSIVRVWWCVLLTFLLDLAAWSTINNVPVIFVRLFGFAIPRAIYRPLEAKNIPEFFARRYYYYKEILFDFFVMPLFLKLKFVSNRKLRLFVAITFGVGTGSAVTHVSMELTLGTANQMDFWITFVPMLVRGYLFGAVIGLYQFGNPFPIGKGAWAPLSRALNLLIIVLFFALAKPFAPAMLTEDPWSGLRFVAYMFGMNGN